MIGISKKTEECFASVKCHSCGKDNWIDASLIETKEWDCWYCNHYLCTVVGGEGREHNWYQSRVFHIGPSEPIFAGEEDADHV